MKHDCEPWVSQFGTCPFALLDEEDDEEEDDDAQEQKAALPDDLDEFNTSDERGRFPWELLLPFLSDAGYGQQGRVDLEHFRFEEDRRRFTAPRTIPDTEVDWGRVAAILTGILAGTAVFLQRRHPMGQIAARAMANEGVPFVLASHEPPKTFREAVRKRLKWPYAWRSSSAPHGDPDVEGGPEGPILDPVKDFGVWYYISFQQQQDLTWGLNTTRGPRWINPADPQWTSLWGAFWAWSPTPSGLGGARAPSRPGDRAPGDWNIDPRVFELAATGTPSTRIIDESLLDDSMI